MKKNWIPIIFLIVFIIAYNALVISPHNEKLRQAQLAQQQAAQSQVESQAPQATGTPSTPQGAQASKGASSAEYVPPPVTEDKAAPLTDEARAAGTQVVLSADREVTLFPNGSIGSAVFK